MTQEERNQLEYDNPDNWSCGFYFSKKDSRTWVPKRPAWMGWTLNIGQKDGACWLLGFIIGIPILIISLHIILK